MFLNIKAEDQAFFVTNVAQIECFSFRKAEIWLITLVCTWVVRLTLLCGKQLVIYFVVL